MNIEEMQKQLDELPENESKRIIQFLLYTDIKSMKEKFDKEYMLYKNMYNNHREAFDIYKYIDSDKNIRGQIGILERIDINDLIL